MSMTAALSNETSGAHVRGLVMTLISLVLLSAWSHRDDAIGFSSVAQEKAMALALDNAGEITPAPLSSEDQHIVGYLSRRYRVAPPAVADIVAAARASAAQYRLDPLLILAVTGIESRYNPLAHSSFGALGLMQIIPKYHPEKLSDYSGPLALLDPQVNVEVGARILREYLSRTGDMTRALAMYGGDSGASEIRYSDKVMGELARLRAYLQRQGVAVTSMPEQDSKPA